MAPAAVYTVEQVVESGLRNSEELKKVEEEINKTRYQIYEAYGSATPKLDASANYQHSFNDITSTTISSIMQPFSTDEPGAYALSNVLDGVLGAMMPKPQSLSLSLSLSQPLFAQGKVGIGLKIAKAYNQSLRTKKSEVEQTTKGNLRKMFYGALLAKKNLEIQKESVRLSAETHRLSKARYVVGKGSELDTLLTQLSHEKALISLQTSSDEQKLAYLVLIKQAGLPDAPESLEIAGDFPKDDYSISREQAMVKLEANNLSRKQLESAGRVQEQLVNLAKSDFYPMIYCGASYSKISQFDNGETPEWIDDKRVFAGATLNLFSGFRNVQKVKQARSDQRSFEQSKKQAEKGLEIGLQKSFDQIQAGRNRLRSMDAVVRLAEKGYSIRKKSYEVGSSTLLDLQNAEIELKSARLGQSAAQFGFYAAVIDLKMLLGELE